MIEAKFEYSYQYIKDLNKSTMKTYNMIGQIALFLIFCGIGVMFGVSKNILLGVLISITFVILLVGFVSANKAVERANRALLGQHIDLSFSEGEMTMTASVEGENFYTARIDYKTIKSVKVKDNLMYINFNKNSAVIVPKSAFKTEENFVKALERVTNNYVI